MKIRIQDNSIRLRMTLREVEDFLRVGQIERSTPILNVGGPGGVFVYRLECGGELGESEVSLDGCCIAVRLCAADRNILADPGKEGVYIRREWVSAEGRVQRFMAFVEKDRPGSTCVKPERWIYDEPKDGPMQTRPIPSREDGDTIGGGGDVSIIR